MNKNMENTNSQINIKYFISLKDEKNIKSSQQIIIINTHAIINIEKMKIAVQSAKSRMVMRGGGIHINVYMQYPYLRTNTCKKSIQRAN